MSEATWTEAREYWARRSDALVGTPLAKKIEDSRWDAIEIATVIILSLAAILTVVFCAQTPDPTYLGSFLGSIGGVAALYLGYRTYKVLSTQKEMKKDDADPNHPLLKEVFNATLKVIKKNDEKQEKQGNEAYSKRENYDEVTKWLSSQL